MVGHMPEPCPVRTATRYAETTVGVAEVAANQWGVISHAQLRECGVSRNGIARRTAAGTLYRVHPGVFAVGHLALGIEARLTAALFYAGRGAALFGTTAGWWLGIVDVKPTVLHVIAPRKRRSLDEVRVHRTKQIQRIRHNRLPVTPPAQTLLAIADQVGLTQVLRRALAEAEYLGLVTVDDVAAVLGRAKPGSANLRAALETHRPQLARTRSKLEEKFVLLSERHFVSQPSVNVRVAGWLVDAVWFEKKVVVELDSRTAHSTSRTIENDHRRDMDIRAAGFIVLRYTWRQLVDEPRRVVADLRRHGIS